MIRCWMCGVEPTGLADVSTFGDLARGARRLVPTGWPPGDHEHAIDPPTPSDLAEAGDRALARVLAEWTR